MSREDKFFLITLAEQSGRYEDARFYFLAFLDDYSDLSHLERNSLYITYRKLISARRNAWNPIFLLEQKEKSKILDNKRYLLTLYRVKLEKEMNGLCNEIVSVIDSKLIMLAGDPESRVFYWKMKGDYYRYQAEYQLSGDNKEHYTLEAAEKGFEAYETASFIALSDLPPTHPVRLGLALNFSVFFKEIMKAPDRALTLARTAYQDGFSEISRSDSSPKEETRTIMKLLSENITLWSKETETQNPYF